MLVQIGFTVMHVVFLMRWQKTVKWVIKLFHINILQWCNAMGYHPHWYTMEIWTRSVELASYKVQDHYSGQRVMSLPLIQWAKVQILVGSVSWLRFIRDFPSTVRWMSGNLGHICPWIHLAIIIIQTILHPFIDGDCLWLQLQYMAIVK